MGCPRRVGKIGYHVCQRKKPHRICKQESLNQNWSGLPRRRTRAAQHGTARHSAPRSHQAPSPFFPSSSQPTLFPFRCLYSLGRRHTKRLHLLRRTTRRLDGPVSYLHARPRGPHSSSYPVSRICICGFTKYSLSSHWRILSALTYTGEKRNMHSRMTSKIKY